MIRGEDERAGGGREHAPRGGERGDRAGGGGEPCQVDEAPREITIETRHKRRALVDAAGQALWLFVVQREAIGLRDMRTLMRDYGVPAEVFNRMGAAPIKAS